MQNDMVARQTSGRKPKTVIVHQCSKAEMLDRMNMVLFGNGHPEDGLAFLVRAFIKDQTAMHENIDAIKNSITGLYQKYDETYDAAERAQHAIDNYKLEEEAFAKGKEEVEEKVGKKTAEGRENFNKNVGFWMLIVTAFGLLVTMILTLASNKKVENRILDWGSPRYINSRTGQDEPLPKGYELKMWPNDFVGDTTETDSIR